MTLKELIYMIDDDECITYEYYNPSWLHGKTKLEIDSRPDSVYKITLCFMAEEETWMTCDLNNIVLLPFYDCEVSSFQPGDEYTIEVWLKYEDYVMERWKDHLQEVHHHDTNK